MLFHTDIHQREVCEKEREIRNGSANGGVSNNSLIGVNECICKGSGFGKWSRRYQDSNLRVGFLCSKIFKNCNINIKGCQQCIISINFLIICIFYFFFKSHMTIYNQEFCKL